MREAAHPRGYMGLFFLVLAGTLPDGLAAASLPTGTVAVLGQHEVFSSRTTAAAATRSSSPSEDVAVEAAYIADAFYNMSGGLRRGGTVLHNVDLTLGVDGGALVGVPGLRAFVYVLGNFGGSVGELAGDWQGASNIEAPHAVRLYEAWIEQNWSGWSFLAGLYDLNSEFYVAESAQLFLNSAHGIGGEFAASGSNGPSIFPVTSLTARLRWQPSAVYAQLAILDAVPGDVDRQRFVHIRLDEGVLVAGEVGYSTQATASRYNRKIALGGWGYTTDFPDAVEPDLTHNGTWGTYLLMDAEVTREAGAALQGLAAYARIGFAHEDVHPVSWSWGGGVVYTGLFPGRDEDRFGASITTASHGTRYLRARSGTGDVALARSELALELTYTARVFEWLRVQPDLQYIVNPGFEAEAANALLLALRAEVSL